MSIYRELAQHQVGYSAQSPFKEFLKNNGVEVPHDAADIEPRERRVKGRSKQKKWSCGCTNIRCAVADLHAQCLKCAHVFRCIELGKEECHG